MANPIPLAGENTDPLQQPETRQYRTVEIATRRGIQKKRVREDRLEKRYGRLDYKNREVYARKVKVVTERKQKDGSIRIRTEERAVNPRQLQRQYTYVRGEYKRYEPERLQTVRTTTGREVMATERELHTGFRRKGTRYEVIRKQGRLTTYRIRREERQYRYQRPPSQYTVPQRGQTYLIEARVTTQDGSTFELSGYRNFAISLSADEMDDYLRERIQQIAYHTYGINYADVKDVEIIALTAVSLEREEPG